MFWLIRLVHELSLTNGSATPFHVFKGLDIPVDSILLFRQFNLFLCEVIVLIKEGAVQDMDSLADTGVIRFFDV
jgi:hypothetical protein